MIGNVYVFPAIVGLFIGAFAVAASVKARAMAVATVPENVLTAQPEMRKAS